MAAVAQRLDGDMIRAGIEVGADRVRDPLGGAVRLWQ
jgi:hypothetical protein